MKLDPETITWIEQKTDEISQQHGYGDVMVTWHIRKGKLEWTEKSTIQTERNVSERILNKKCL